MTEQPWRIALAVLLLGALGAGVVMAVRSSTGDGPPPTTTIPFAAPAATATTDSPPVVPPSVTVAPITTTASSVAGTFAPPETVALADVLPAAQRALADWGAFAVTGDLAVVADSFDLAGPQYQQLTMEAAALAADPAGPPPYVFAMGEIELERPRPQRVVLVGPVVMTRPGEADQTFRWRLHLRWSGSEWLLWTVETVDQSGSDQ